MNINILPCILCIVALNVYGQVPDPTFKTELVQGDYVSEAILLPDGKIVIAGRINAYAQNGTATGKIARLNPDGSFDPSFVTGTGVNGSVYSIAVQPDGKLIMGGYFTNYNGTASNNLVRVNPDGSVDPSFIIGAGLNGDDNFISNIIIDMSGKIYITGYVTKFNGVSCNMVARLNPDGSLDTSFLMPTTHRGEVADMALQADGKIIIGGRVTKVNSVGGASVVVRLNSNGSLDTDFLISSSTLHQVYSVAVQGDGKILVGGDFTSYNGESYPYLVRLLGNGLIDATFKHSLKSFHSGIGPYGTLTDIQVQPNGMIMLGGNIYAYGNTVLNDVARLNPDGTLASNFAACKHTGGIDFVRMQPDGNLLLFGSVGARRILGDSTIPPQPVPDFDFITVGREVSFVNQSTGALDFEWSFGDGNYSTLSNPLHSYGYSGNFTARLTAKGYCDVEVTKSKTVSVLDLQRVTPTNASNKGLLAIRVVGNGLLPNASVTLVKGKRIPATYVNATPDGKELIASFNLSDEAVGLYEVEVKQGSTTKRLRDAITLELPDATVDLDVEIFGRPNLRRGVAQKYEIKVSNYSNRTIRGVPCFITVPKHTKVEFENYIVKEDDGAIHFSANDLFGTVGDSVDVYSFLIPVIFADNNKVISALVTSEINQGEQLSLKAWAYPALYNTPRNPNFTDCLDEAFKAAITPDLMTCYFSAKNFGEHTLSDEQAYAMVANEAELNKPGGIDKLQNALVSFFRRATKVVTDCSGASSPPSNITKKDGLFIALMKAAVKGFSTWGECASSLPAPIIRELKARIVASNDPNEKVGLLGSTSENFIIGLQQFDYTIYFENLSSATAPAQEVIIIDTLDTQHLDIATFSLKAFGFGTIPAVTVPDGLSAYTATIDMRPNLEMKVRVNAKLNIEQGIVTWRFFSLDPLTNERIDDPLAGFLPPNISDPNGTGFVSYSITPKKDLVSGTQIKNRASIFFDANAPIHTNIFVNTIDKTNPTSGIKSLSRTAVDSIYTVTWEGKDGASGVRSYDLYYSVNDGKFRLWQFDVTGNQTTINLKRDSLYSFYSIAKDYAGNIENAKQSGEASTQLITAVEGGEKFNPFTIFPNPSHGKMTVNFELTQPADIKMTLKTLQGQNLIKISEDRFSQGKHSLPVSIVDVPQGFYVCEFIVNDIRYISKLVKL